MDEESVKVSRQDLLVLVHAGRGSREAHVQEAAARIGREINPGDDVMLVLETRVAIIRAKERIVAREADEAAIRERARAGVRRLSPGAKRNGKAPDA
jgi:hypothetical protein